MFDLGWTEMMVIGIVALIVVGPKDLPGLFRSVGQFVGKAKGMAREFSSAMNAAADEAGVNEINKTIKAAANPQQFGADKLREATKWDSDADSETDKLRGKMTDERKANAKKINDAMARAAEDRLEAEEDAAFEAQMSAAPDVREPADAPAKASPAAPKTSAPKKAAPKKAGAAKTPAAKKPAASATKAPAAKKPAAKKPASKAATTAKPASAKAKPRVKPKTAAKPAGPASSTSKDES